MICLAWKPLLAASAATLGSAAAAAFCVMDCNPKLYIYEKLFYNPRNAFQGQSVWIVGASSGIGRELAIQLARAGCKRLILSSRKETKLLELAQLINSTSIPNNQKQQQLQETCSCECICLPLDVTNDSSALKLAVQNVYQDCCCRDSLDMVILNAGAGQLCPALEITDPDAVVKNTMMVNAIWPMILMPLFLPYNNKEQQLPRILVTSSVAALLPIPLSAPYAAAKAALQHYFVSLASERPDLSINICCPGTVDSEFHHHHHGHPPVASGVDNDYRRSDLKMSVERCARLMLASVAAAATFGSRGRGGGLTESWIARQPVLAVLYLQKWLPTSIMAWLLARVGTKRVQMWRDGLDLYDPDSWKRR